VSDILLDSTGDIDLTDGQLTLTTGLVATKQRLSQRLSLFAGEWFLDRTRGIPYIEQVFVKQPNPVVIDAVFKNEILSDPAVLELTKFELDLEVATRVLTITFSAITDDGPIDFLEAFSV